MNDERIAIPAGLCSSCCHLRLVESARGSRFVLCGYVAAGKCDWPKYPRLPVLQCREHTPRTSAANRPDETEI